MYILKAEHSFDSAHFLANYDGKCGNIHGHRWRIIVEVQGEKLETGGQTRGMIVDFGDLKRELKELVDYYDHSLVIEVDTMRAETLGNLEQDGFKVVMVAFRPTAENFARFFFEAIEQKGYEVKRAVVYETPTNCATYER